MWSLQYVVARGLIDGSNGARSNGAGSNGAGLNVQGLCNGVCLIG
jgi:hypothetical protein